MTVIRRWLIFTRPTLKNRGGRLRSRHFLPHEGGESFQIAGYQIIAQDVLEERMLPAKANDRGERPLPAASINWNGIVVVI